MQCRSCGTVLDSTFKHAFAQNICPACGGAIMDEESLALIEDITATLASNATLRDETAHNLALVMVANYTINVRTGKTVAAVSGAGPKVPQKSKSIARIPQANHVDKEPQVITAAQMQNISEEERVEIMSKVAQERYNLSDGIMNVDPDDDLQDNPFPTTDISPFTEGNISPVLEQDRQARLQKQQNSLQAGKGLIHRR